MQNEYQESQKSQAGSKAAPSIAPSKLSQVTRSEKSVISETQSRLTKAIMAELRKYFSNRNLGVDDFLKELQEADPDGFEKLLQIGK